jgi:polar amino acid transport system permease protein
LPRRLTPEALFDARQVLSLLLLAYAGCAAILHLILATARARLGLIAAWGLICINGLGLTYLLLAAHLGFALGLFTSLRAAIFAYGLACVLGLTWAGLLNYAPGVRTFVIFPLIVLALLAGAAFYLMQEPVAYDLIGSLEGRVAIIKGTPQPLIDQVRHGDFPHAEVPGVNTSDLNVRTVLDANQALSVLSAKQGVTAALLPHAALADPSIDQAAGHLWSTQLLPDAARIPGISLLILGIGLGLLTFGAWQNDRHPLAVAAEFIIDTVRGIPMLVIILYIGLPVSGAIKEATGGAIDMSNVARGVIALALCYSAYLAEIFRAGIEAIPHGQVEAARSLGLSRWQAARRIILPQALRIVVPPLGNEFIAIMKDSSLLSVLSVRDITQRMREFQSASFLTFAPFNAAAVLYICLTLAAASGIKWIERKYNVKSR